MGLKGLVTPLLLSGVLFSAAAGAIDLNDPDQGWKDTATDTETVRLFIEEKYPCSKSAAHALGCVKLINGLGMYTKPKLAFVPKGQIPPGMEVKIVKAGPYLDYVEIVKPAAQSASLSEFSAQIKRDEDALRAAVTKMTAEKITVDFMALTLQMVNKRDQEANVSQERMIGEAINQLIEVHDGHGGIKSRAFQQAQMASADQSFFGVGLQIQMQTTLQQPVVIMPVEGSAAGKVGVLPKDVIAKIDGAETKGMTLEAVVAKLRGGLGEPVKVELIRAGVDKPIELTIVRAKVEAKNVKHKVLEDMGKKVAYISAGQFDGAICDDIKRALWETTSVLGVQAVILDLRNDPGGLLDQAICVGGIFAGPKVIVGRRTVENGETKPELVQMMSDEEARTRLPVIVMVNERSASASEVVSGALQDHRRAIILGTRSFGKATIQRVGEWEEQKDLDMRQTIGRFYQPSDRTNQIVGIQPDIEVYRKPNPSAEEKFAMREAEQVPSALKPVGAEWTQPRPDKIAGLAPCFQQRAEQLFKNEESEDYQLLKAQELAVCPAFAQLNDEYLREQQQSQ